MNPLFTKDVLARFFSHRLAKFCLFVLFFFLIIAIYAPFLASSKPIFVLFNRESYFPLFHYLFYKGFYSKVVDRFFNLMMFTFPLFLLCRTNKGRSFIIFLQIIGFFLLESFPVRDPSYFLKKDHNYENQWMQSSPNYKIGVLLSDRLKKSSHKRVSQYVEQPTNTLYFIESQQYLDKLDYYQKKMHSSLKKGDKKLFESSYNAFSYLATRKEIHAMQQNKLQFVLMPFLREFHWEEDAGGSQGLNQKLPWWELTRTNRKDLVASLIFGTRISLVVGVIAVSIALLFAVPLGLTAGYFGGRWDLILSRFFEIWESMPLFFMLLFIVAILESKSLLLVIFIIGLFGWTNLARFVRAESLKQRHLSYVDACRVQGFSEGRTLFYHVLPNTLPPLITLLPFAMMAAITSEAALSFLGLGEEGSCSWGVLMDEGRQAFPGESNLLWPPAALLTILLICIAIVGDGLRDALDPKLKN